MDEERMRRRQLLADLLFVGGALAASSLGAWLQSHPGREEALHYPSYYSSQGLVEHP